MSIPTDRSYAENLDRADPLSSFRDRFYVHDGTIYLDGNSLGLLSRDAEQAVLDVLEQWKTLGIDGWLRADPPWFYLGEELGRRSAELVGAKADEMVVTGGTTVNLHALVSTFYRPDDRRRKIIATSLDFPSDIYALEAQITLAGGDPERDLIKVESSDGRTMDDEAVIQAMTDDVALAMLPSVLYRSGQLLDIERITAAAHERGITIGWDCAHSAGVIPHRFDEWDIDFAFWCNYKYLNAGPGSIASIYVNERHFDKSPALPGWWGYNKQHQFDMSHQFESAHGAGAWQISTISVLSAAPLIGSVAIATEAGIERIREQSLARTDYLIELLGGSGLLEAEYGYSIGTPLDHDRRGGHLAIEHEHGPQITRALKSRGVVPDFRPPNVVRLAPIPLYTSYVEIWETVQHLREVIDSGAYQQQTTGRDVVA